MNKIKLICIVLLLSIAELAYAGVSLSIQNNGHLIFSGNLDLPDVGEVMINDTNHNPHSVNARSVLNIIYNADQADARFNISDLVYYESFSAFYLKCINLEYVNQCNEWLYTVNGLSPAVGMDQAILSDGDIVSLFYKAEAPMSVAHGGPILEWPREPVEVLPPPIIPDLIEPVEAQEELEQIGEPLVPELVQTKTSTKPKIVQTSQKRHQVQIEREEEAQEVLIQEKPKGISCIFSKLVAYFIYEKKYENQKTLTPERLREKCSYL